MRRVLASAIGGGLLLMVPRIASATLESVSQSALFAQTPTVTFASVPPAFQNTPLSNVLFQFVGGAFNGSYMIFTSIFAGQNLSFGVAQANVTEPSAPGQPLQPEAGASDYVVVTNDAASPSNPVLAGGPYTFREPVSILLTQPTSAIGLTIGFLDTLGTLTIDAYTAGGAEIGSVTNTTTGFEAFGLLDPDGAAISGLTIQSTDPAGFEVNDVFLASAVPEPAAWATLAAGLAALVGARRRWAYGRGRQTSG